VNLAVEDINATKKRLRIEIPADVIEKEIGNSLQKLKQKAKIPGFRPGTAPVNLLEKRFGKEIEAEVLDKVIPEYFRKAIKEANIEPVTFPVMDEKIGLERNKPLNLSFTVEILPKIGEIQYENITIKETPVAVNDSDVDDYLKSLQESRAVFEVAEKDIEVDDLVSFEFIDCSIQGEEITPPSVKEAVSQMGNEILPLDIMDKVLGKKKGDLLEFSTTFNESCESKDLVGKTADMKLKIGEIKKKNLPAIDDDFAKDLGFENVNEMREKIHERILAIKKEHVGKLHKAKIMNQILEPHNFDVPETLLEKELQSLIMRESMSKNEPRETDAQEGSEVKDEETLRAEMKQKALMNVRASIILDAIGEKEGITVSDDEVNERISILAKRLSTSPEMVRTYYTHQEGTLEGLRHSIFEDKVLDLLLSKATLEKGE
jgi:trigger factor